MRVHLIKEQTIRDYMWRNAASRGRFQAWISLIRISDWSYPEDIRATFPTADLLGNGSQRVVFDIGGNHYRMICTYLFGKNKVHLFVKWIGTHAAYDRICAQNKQYTIDEF